MIQEDTREKVRAVFLAALMVVSVFGGTMAFAGSAAATSGPTLDDATVQSGTDVKVSGVHSSPGDDLTFAIDTAGNNEINKDDLVKTETSDSDGKASVTFDTSSLGEGEYEVVAIEEGSDDGTTDLDYPVDISNRATTTLTVDDTAPTAENPSPTGVVSDATPTITLDLTEEQTSINASTIEVEVTDQNGEIQYYRLDATKAQGISFSDGTLTIDVEQTKLDRLPDDSTITVDVSAKDEAGNALDGTSTTSFSFDVDTNPVDVSFDDVPQNTVIDDSQSFVISVSSTSADIATANVEISGEGYSETFDTSSDVYDKSTGEFSFSAGSTNDDEISALPEGEITIDVSATDADGKTNSGTHTFTVDTTGPSVEGISVNNGELVNTEDANEVPITVTFDEPVDASTVNGEIHLDGDGTEEVTLGGNGVSPTATSEDGKSVAYVVDLSGYDVDTASAEVRFSSADDVHTNTNSELDAKQTFSIDTIAPTINEETGVPSPAVSGVVDFAGSYSASDADGGELTYYVKTGQEGDYEKLSSYDTLSDFDTTTLPEGVHDFKVSIEDDAGNYVEETTTLTVDNVEPTAEYVGPGHDVDSGYGLRGEVTVSDLFDIENAGTEEVTITVNTPRSSSYQELDSFNVNEEGHGDYLFKVKVDDPGYDGSPNEITVFDDSVPGQSITADDLNLETEVNNEDGTVTVILQSDVTLDSANVSVTTTDSHYDKSTTVLSLDEFEENNDKSGDKTLGFVKTFDAPRDGEYRFAIEDASYGQAPDKKVYDPVRYGDDPVTDTNVKVDSEDPSIADADVVGADEDSMEVRVRFSEPIDGANWPQFTGNADVVDITDETPDDAEVTLVLSNEAQTGGNEKISVTGLTEEYNTDGSDPVESSEDVDFALELSQGMNVVSVPAEMGGVSISDLDLDGVETILTYDDGEWTRHTVATGEGDLQTLEGGQGYIVWAMEDTEVDVEVFNVGQVGKRSSEDLESGWNLVGHYQEGTQSADQAFTWLNGNTWSVEKGYSGDQAQQLEPGQGYWLAVDESDTHMPVPYAGVDSERPDVYTESGADAVTTDVVKNGDTMTVEVRVDDNSPVQQVVVDAPELGIRGEPLDLTTPESAGSTHGVYSAQLDVDYPEWYDGSYDVPVTVTAMDNDGNIGELSETVDPEKRSAGLTITDANTDDGEVAVRVDDATNVENAELEVQVGDLGPFTTTAKVDTGNTFTVALSGEQLSQLDDGDAITATLYERDDSSDEREFAVAGASDSINEPDQMAYDEDGNTFTGSTAVHDAVSSADETVYVEDATYETNQRIVVDKSITIKSAGDYKPVVSYVQPDATNNPGYPTFDVQADNVRIDGLTIKLDVSDSYSGSTRHAQAVKVGGFNAAGGSGAEIVNNDIAFVGSDNSQITTSGVGVLAPADAGDLDGATVENNHIAGFNMGILVSDHYGEILNVPEDLESPNTFENNGQNVYDDRGPEVSSVDATSGDTVEVTYNEGVILSTGDSTGFTVTVDGDQKTISSASVSNGDTVVLTLDATHIDSSSTVDVAYDSTDENVEDSAGYAAGDYTESGVSNSAPDTAEFSSAATASSSTIEVTFDEAVTASDASGFTVTVNGNEKALDSTISGSTTKTLTLTLSSYTIQSGDSISVSYDGTGDVTDDDGGNDVVVFGDKTVTNHV